MRQLYSAAVVQVFGHGSKHPARAACWRLGVALASAVVAGHCIAAQFRAATLPFAAKPMLVFVFACFTIQLCISLALIIALGVNQRSSQDAFARLLMILPLARRQRWLSLQITTIALSSLALAIIAEPIDMLLGKLGLPMMATVAACCIGALSAFGLFTGFGRWPITAQLGAVGAAIATEYYILHHILRQAALGQATGHSVAMLGFVGATLVALIPTDILGVAYRITRPCSARQVHSAWTPAVCWPYKVIIRSSMHISVLVNLALSGGVIVTATRLHARLDPTLGSFIAAVLAGSLAADVRGLFRQRRPPEIVALRGSSYFVISTFFATCIMGAVSVSPLLYSVLHTSGYADWPSAASQLLLGVSAGFAASSFLIPTARDILGQFAAALLCLGVLAGLPLLPSLHSASQSKIALINLTVAIAFFCAAHVIELQRNNFTWRKYGYSVKK